MNKETEKQVDQWLKKLERESWQLELLVSAFTIFLLINAQQSFSDYIAQLNYEYYGVVGMLIFFLSLILTSIFALTTFLIIHLLLRGFWIGAIGLRSVQPTIDYEGLGYSDFFKERLKKKLIGLDRLVVILDELCSVIFSMSFLIIFMIISFGLFILFLILVGGALGAFLELTHLEFEGAIFFLFTGILFIILLTGVVYLIDYFTLGFFKRFNRLSRIYYPIYRFYGTITLSFISRSIYYNLISKYSKRSIRLLLSSFLVLIFITSLVRFDQHTFFPEGESDHLLLSNYYDDLRSKEDYIEKVSVGSKYVDSDFISLFIRYNPRDNDRIQSNCLNFEPLKNDGINPTRKFELTKNGLRISSEKFEDEDKQMLLQCLSDFYEISVNNEVYQDLSYYFYQHPTNDQKGILTVFSTDKLQPGENIINIRKSYVDSSDSSIVSEDYARVPVWLVNDRE